MGHKRRSFGDSQVCKRSSGASKAGSSEDDLWVELTRSNTGLVLNVAFNYGGRSEIARAVQRVLAQGVRAEDVTEELIDRHLDTAGLPDLDLVIRTGGEMRLSNFLLWQAAYAEYYSTPICWPDFGREELYQAFAEFGRRVRRFGGLS